MAPNRPALHKGDGVLAILPRRRCRQPQNVARLNLFAHLLERKGRQVMALVDDYLAVVSNRITDLAFPPEALNDCNIDNASQRKVLPPPICLLNQVAAQGTWTTVPATGPETAAGVQLPVCSSSGEQ